MGSIGTARHQRYVAGACGVPNAVEGNVRIDDLSRPQTQPKEPNPKNPTKNPTKKALFAMVGLNLPSVAALCLHRYKGNPVWGGTRPNKAEAAGQPWVYREATNKYWLYTTTNGNPPRAHIASSADGLAWVNVTEGTMTSTSFRAFSSLASVNAPNTVLYRVVFATLLDVLR